MSLNQYSQFAQKMIGLNRQIFRLNNVRTFFLSVSNTSPSKKRKRTKSPIRPLNEFDGEITTKTKALSYKMALVRDNVRVMTVHDKELDKDNVYWAIRVGVGSDDDPDQCQGLAHLLEHVICRTYENKNEPIDYACRTMNFETKFSFVVPFDNDAEASRRWIEIMFSCSDIENEDNMKEERKLVDNEYQEKRNSLGFIDNRTAVILKQKKDITLAKFGTGTRKTLRQFDDHELMAALKELRKRYRERPLNVCVYSANKIEMADVIDSLEFHGSITQEQRIEAREPNWEKRLKDVRAQHLIVQQSFNDSIQLDIIYPFHKKLKLDEEDTFTIVGNLITKKIEGQLGHVLFEKKMATECTGGANMNINSFVVTIRLTADGLKRIRQVTSMVHDYFQFLHDNWQGIETQPLIDFNLNTVDEKSNLEYADSIARCLDRVNKPFVEEDLFRPLPPVKGQQLISEQILNNQSIQHTIAARNVDCVYDTLSIAGLAAKGDKETEDIIGTQFHCLETGLFAAPSNFDNFTPPELSPKDVINEHTEKFPVFINVPNDEAFLALCSHYLALTTASLVMPLNLKNGVKYGISRRHGGSIFLKLDRENTKKYSEKLHPETEIDFKYYKQSLMERYSVIMTDSKKLARSLLKTALENLTCNIKRDSVPLQYNVLKDMDFSKYKHHFDNEGYDSDVKKIKYKKVSRRFDETFVIESMNVDESSTVTLAFLQRPVNNNVHTLCLRLYHILRHELFPNLYTNSCDYAKFGAANGILLTLVSVEEKKLQTGVEILNLLEEKMEPLVLKAIEKHHPEPEQNEDLRNLWIKMRKRQIIIQIVGHENGGYPSGPFQTHFVQWLGDHEEDFEDINKL